MAHLTENELEQVEKLARKLIDFQKRNDLKTFGAAPGRVPPQEEPSLDLVAPADQLMQLFEKREIDAPLLRAFVKKATPRVKELIAELRAIEDAHEPAALMASEPCDECRAAEKEHRRPSTARQTGQGETSITKVGRGKDVSTETPYICTTCGTEWTHRVESGVGGHLRDWVPNPRE